MSAPDDAVRLRQLERSAARREPIHWQKTDGEPILVDRPTARWRRCGQSSRSRSTSPNAWM